MNNKDCLTLCHMTPEEKKEYNAKYYAENSDYWREYYGVKTPRSRQQNVTGESASVSRRGGALGASPPRPREQNITGQSASVFKRPNIPRSREQNVTGESTSVYRHGSSINAEQNRMATPDANARLNAIGNARAEEERRKKQAAAANTMNSSLAARYSAMYSHATTTPVTSISSAAANAGKAILNGLNAFTSAWKLGWK